MEPIDKFKIDRSFVTHICDDQTSLNITRALIDLTRNLGFICIVDGVETVDQLLVLHSTGCRLMQGYLFHQPMPQCKVAAYHRRPLIFGQLPNAARASPQVDCKAA